MKYLVTLIALLFLIACDSEELNPNEKLEGSLWQADNFIAEVIWGGENFQYIDFISLDSVQHYETRNGNLTSIAVGIYRIESPMVTLYLEDDTTTLEIRGSLLISQDYIGNYDQDPLTYIKQ